MTNLNASNFAQNDYSRVIVTVMKDEAPYMLDWVSYHLAIGFTHFVILTNDCSDGTEKIARKLQKLGIVTHKNNPSPHPKGPQKTGYQRMRKLEAVQKAGWLMALDVDEYLRLHVGDGTLDALFEYTNQKPGGYSFVWQLFGNNHVQSIDAEPVYKKFKNSQHPLQARPYETMPIKTLFQKHYFEKIGTHRPIGLREDPNHPLLWIDADGVPMIMYYLHRHWRSYEDGMGFGMILGRINHYALRSLDAFMVKWQRGFVHPTAPTVRGKGTAMDYWKLFNWNQYTEPHHLLQQERAAEIKSQLLDFENMSKISADALEWHQTRAQELAQAFPKEYETLWEMGDSRIDETLPDFSQYGSPKSSNQLYININQLVYKAQHKSILNPKDIEDFYRAL